MNPARGRRLDCRGRNAATRRFETALGGLQFQDAKQAPSATEAKYVSIAIGLAEEIIPDDLGGDKAEGDAVPTVTQRKIGVPKPGMDTDVRQAVFRFTESAGPGIGYFQW